MCSPKLTEKCSHRNVETDFRLCSCTERLRFCTQALQLHSQTQIVMSSSAAALRSLDAQQPGSSLQLQSYSCITLSRSRHSPRIACAHNPYHCSSGALDLHRVCWLARTALGSRLTLRLTFHHTACTPPIVYKTMHSTWHLQMSATVCAVPCVVCCLQTAELDTCMPLLGSSPSSYAQLEPTGHCCTQCQAATINSGLKVALTDHLP